MGTKSTAATTETASRAGCYLIYLCVCASKQQQFLKQDEVWSFSDAQLFLIVSTTVLSVASAQLCNACNCQFNNVQVLSQLIEVQVNRALANEPRKSHIFPNDIFQITVSLYNTFYNTIIFISPAQSQYIVNQQVQML